MGIKLYQHVNNRDVAVEVLRLVKVPNKSYYKIRVRWWNVVSASRKYCLGFEEWLTDASIVGKKKNRQKYPKKKWEQEWRLLR
jgi:hypothetical protein